MEKEKKENGKYRMVGWILTILLFLLVFTFFHPPATWDEILNPKAEQEPQECNTCEFLNDNMSDQIYGGIVSADPDLCKNASSIDDCARLYCIESCERLREMKNLSEVKAVDYSIADEVRCLCYF